MTTKTEIYNDIALFETILGEGISIGNEILYTKVDILSKMKIFLDNKNS